MYRNIVCVYIEEGAYICNIDFNYIYYTVNSLSKKSKLLTKLILIVSIISFMVYIMFF